MDIRYETEQTGKEYVIINGRRFKLCSNGSYVYINDGKRGIGLHRYIMQLYLGRKLGRHEHVHHIDEDKTNNVLNNLEVVPGRIHDAFHTRQRNLKHDPETFVCADCGIEGRSHKAFGLCTNCYAKLRRKQSTIRPCVSCGRETINGTIRNGMCHICLSHSWDSCRVCFRKRSELPGGHGRTRINSDGLCHACSERLKRRAAEK